MITYEDIKPRKIDCGDWGYSSGAIKNDNTLDALPSNYAGYNWQSSKPLDNNIVEVGCGHTHGVVLLETGQVKSWGYDMSGLVADTPTGNDFISVAAGRGIHIALRDDGTVVSWGEGFAQQPDNDVVQVSTRRGVSYFLKADGSMRAVQGTALPSGTYAQVSAGYNKGLGLRTDGSLAGVGNVGTLPSGNDFKWCACYDWCAAIRNDGELLIWGASAPVPPTKKGFVQVAIGENCMLALNEDGTLWAGGHSNFINNVPTTDDYYIFIPTKFLIKSNTTFYNYDGTAWIDTGLSEPLTQADYETHGMGNSRELTEQKTASINIHGLKSGNITTSKVNKSDYGKFNKIKII